VSWTAQTAGSSFVYHYTQYQADYCSQRHPCHQGALSVFEIPYIMTRGLNGSTTFVIQTVSLAFNFGKVGLASAMAIVYWCSL